MKPFHQGKLDVFCAMYAVLNGLKITHGLRTLRARDILHETLLALSVNQEAFRAVLEQRTDYVRLVDGMLQIQGRKLPLRVERPFADDAPRSAPDAETVWNACARWLGGGPSRAVLFRFLRYMTPDAPALNKHWTTACRLEGRTLHFFDCSHEEEAIYKVVRGGFVTRPEDVRSDCLICIEPYTMRFLAPKGNGGPL